MKCSISIFIFLIHVSAFADPVIIDKSFDEKDIGLNLEYFEDVNGNLVIDDIAGNNTGKYGWKKPGAMSPGFGFTGSVYWVRFRVENKTGKEAEWLLEQKYPLIDNIILYLPSENNKFKIIETGASYKFSKRPVRYRTFVFPVTTREGRSETYYLKYKTSSSMNIGLVMYTPGEYKKMRDSEAPILWMFYGILLVMIIYNLFIFISVRDLSYLFYILMIMTFILLSLMLDGNGYQYLWPNSPYWAKFSIPLFIGLTIIFVQLFGRYFVIGEVSFGNYDKFNFAALSIELLIALSSFIINNYRISIIAVTIMGAIILVSNSIFLLYFAVVRKLRQSQFFLSSFAFMCLGALLYIFKTYGIVSGGFIVSYSMHIGLVAMVVLLSLGLADRINTMRKEIQKAEKKYRNLVESSNDIIFSLDKGLNFISINQSVKKHLGYKPDDVSGTNFLDYIQETWSEKQNIARRIVEGYVDDLMRSKTSVTFRTDFKSRFSHEPKELSVKLEYGESESGEENILGKASLITDDIILQFLDYEKHNYVADNYLNNAELLSQRLTRNLSKFLKAAEVSDLRVAIREMLINAIEHGNLNLKSEEKAMAMAEGNYLAFIQERQKHPDYKDKNVIIEYILESDSVSYRITDEGDGFDWKAVMENLSANKDGGGPGQGRGLLLACEAFDIIQFNDKGNEVLLVKNFRK